MDRTRKTWGEKFSLHESDSCETSVLYLEPWKRCSWHKHQTKFNIFFVLTGKLVIKLEDGLCEVLPGQMFKTKPGEWHEFQTRELKTTIVEVMFVTYDPEDIEREILGGDYERPEKIQYLLSCRKCGKGYDKKVFPKEMLKEKMICKDCA
jgi:mannose-6-phosphate isomerase-like protein (cupin superfamily)